MNKVWEELIEAIIREDEDAIEKCMKRGVTKKSRKLIEEDDHSDMDETPRRNFVAKHMDKFNRPATHRDRKNSYKRKDKHNKQYMNKLSKGIDE